MKFSRPLVLALSFVAVSANALAGTASDLRARFHAGQTFLTWHQIGEAGRYRIYRSTAPFTTADQLTADRLVAEVGSQTSLNFSASFNIIVLRKFAQTGQRLMIEKPVYYAIAEGQPPLDADTGLFVATAHANESVYYAVVGLDHGAQPQPLLAAPGGNTLLAPVTERIESPEPVLQVSTADHRDYVHWVDDRGTPVYPAMGSLPGVAYNFRLFLPPDTEAAPLPIIAFLHGSGGQYFNKSASWMAPDEKRALLISLDSPVLNNISEIPGFPETGYPPIQGWVGFNENFGTGRSLESGKNRSYTADRVLWTIDWVQTHFHGDPDRVALRGASMGGIGSLLVGLLYPERFSAINAMVPPLGLRSYNSGPVTRRGTNPIQALPWLKAHPGTDVPYIIVTAGRLDTTVHWPDKVPFVREVADLGFAASLFWDLRPHGGNLGADPLPELGGRSPIYWDRNGAVSFDLTRFRRNQSFPAVNHLSTDSDPGTVDFSVPLDHRPAWTVPGAGDPIGSINGSFDWDPASIIDEPDCYEIVLRLRSDVTPDKATADVSPRRRQRFLPTAGTQCAYTVTAIADSAVLASGTVEVDVQGQLLLPTIPIARSAVRIVIQPQAAR